MIVTLIGLQGNSAIVSHRDGEGMMHASIISKDYVEGLTIGTVGDVPDEAIATGTEYGFDLEILAEDSYVVSLSDLQQALRLHGIWTFNDLNQNPNQVRAALMSLVQRMHAKLHDLLREF